MSKRIDTDIDRQKIDELNSKAWDIRIIDSNRAFQLSKEVLSYQKK
jgi:hypothetical protein